ncbi:PREDICTED: uncharacterized protein LOC102860966 [Elephantulus edwardii]|uniref:uncharacterized protein LOC102860966 n=1 Tax=Elephantulus edwardii TaxID=28737 RepID=UPI0003F0C8B9|nr:PREDICTED: uncharacterized protein LOC102860966 [Elephantulus edwardii]
MNGPRDGDEVTVKLVVMKTVTMYVACLSQVCKLSHPLGPRLAALAPGSSPPPSAPSSPLWLPACGPSAPSLPPWPPVYFGLLARKGSVEMRFISSMQGHLSEPAGARAGPGSEGGCSSGCWRRDPGAALGRRPRECAGRDPWQCSRGKVWDRDPGGGVQRKGWPRGGCAPWNGARASERQRVAGVSVLSSGFLPVDLEGERPALSAWQRGHGCGARGRGAGPLGRTQSRSRAMASSVPVRRGLPPLHLLTAGREGPPLATASHHRHQPPA